MDILPIVITAVSVSILWLAYLKFFKNDGSSQNQSELKDKVEPTKKIMLIINSCLTIGDTLYII